ncbi:MAG: UDP-N-acetylmuramoyl-L-alanyl-D-glutamate--2,6-diaminopimelate ligase [Rhizobiales bacterium]|nr:UDP-N-acetylmuramoyl-L-alanyl-D-glutamate--2,6-diaminopimelate ligase [Hyphomicrobiales bacterium]
MKLAEVVGTYTQLAPETAGIEIAGLTADSRQVKPGWLFVAVPGSKADGARFIPDAIAAGASAVIHGPDAQLPPPPPRPFAFIRSKDPRRLLARAAACFHYGQPEVTVAVTGTSGKSSVADFTRQIFTAAGFEAASLGTLGVARADGTVYGSLTTPDPVTLHRTLADLARDGVTHLAFEASSHGLDQRRLDGVRLTAAGYTNLGHDHLDYHPSIEDYLAAKLRLFDTLLSAGQTAVVCADGARSADVVRAARGNGLAVMTVGIAGADLRLERTRREGFRQHLEVRHAGGLVPVTLDLIGTYQATNALVAAGLAVAAGVDTERAVAAIGGLRGVKGRLEVIGNRNGGVAVVDYAHKPDALAAALEALRPFVTGRLICVFGCGGDRDRAKRPVMGGISTRLAGVTIVTDDNPRTEEPAAIRSEILAGAPGAIEIGDRGAAIRAGVEMLQPGDVLLIAGKGHETGQIVGDKVLPFSDQDVVAEAIAAMGAK